MPPLIVAENVGFSYPQKNLGLQPVSFQLSAGQGLFVSSPSGGGKSTLARCITGLIPHLYRGALQGHLSIGGQDTRSAPLWKLVDQAGLVFQNPAAQMITTSVEDEIIFGLENLGLDPIEIHTRLETALQRFGLETLRKRSPRTLSGGEQQKLALACMTARQPQILVLDEPLSMLDTTAALEFIQALDTAREGGQGFVICEHRHEYVRMMTGLDTLILDGHPPDPPDRVAECTDWQGDHATADQIFDRPGQRFVLQAQKLTVVKGGNTLLRELSFELVGGRVVAIVGRNGAGKTTLLRAVAGLQRYEGDLQINGGESGRPSFGMVFQNPDLQLFNATVREEILYRLPDPDLARYQWLMDQLHLQQYEEQAPLLLSEGEKRRVALATTLMHAPRHGILLDEPSLGQDTYHKKILMGVLRSLSRAGMLVVMATHDMELACAADEILLLQAGALLAHGPTSEILAVPETWREAEVRLPDWISHPC